MTRHRRIPRAFGAFFLACVTLAPAAPAFAFESTSDATSSDVAADAATARGSATTATATAAGISPWLPGVDVSHWNGKIRWRKVAASGIRFAIAKASQGRSFVDPRYRRNRRLAERAGIRFSAYHYATPSRGRRDAVREAAHFVRTARLAPRHLVPVLDLEETGGLGDRALKRWTWRWVRTVRDRVGVKPMIYTTAGFWRSYLDDTHAFARAGYPMWIAHWDTDRPSLPAQRWGGNGWTVWQYTDCGHVPGFPGCVDRNRFNGTVLKRLSIARLAS
jgi:lysozyme